MVHGFLIEKRKEREDKYKISCIAFSGDEPEVTREGKGSLDIL